MKTRDIALASMISALYAVGVIVFAPISFLIFQVRIADALIPLSIVFADGKTIQQTATPPTATWTFGYTSDSSFNSISVGFSLSSQ